MSDKPEGELRIEYMPLSSLRRTPGNPKDHSLDQIHLSMDRFGYTSPMLINEASGNLVAGHGRLDALQQKKASGAKPPRHIVDRAGEWLVPVIRGLSFANDDEARAYVVADNRLVELGGWHEDLLVPLLADLATKPDGLVGVGFDGDDRMLRDIQRASGQPLTNQDNEPAPSEQLRKKWGCEPGQTWAVGPHRIWCGDSREVPTTLFQGNKIRMVWTDPPYGVDYEASAVTMEQRRLLHRSVSRPSKAIANDALSPEETGQLLCDALTVAASHAEVGAACYVSSPSGSLLPAMLKGFSDSPFVYHHGLAWVKNSLVLGRADYHYRHEAILYGWLGNGAHYFAPDRTQDSVFEVDKPHSSEMHPTTKPIELIARMIANSSQPGDLVYDCFLGSGSTLVAAHQLGRIGYGCEVDAGYVAVALERLSALGLKPDLAAEAETEALAGRPDLKRPAQPPVDRPA